jgi:hypothetical protein
MSVTRELDRDVSRGCIRHIRDYGHVILVQGHNPCTRGSGIFHHKSVCEVRCGRDTVRSEKEHGLNFSSVHLSESDIVANASDSADQQQTPSLLISSC